MSWFEILKDEERTPIQENTWTAPGIPASSVEHLTSNPVIRAKTYDGTRGFAVPNQSNKGFATYLLYAITRTEPDISEQFYRTMGPNEKERDTGLKFMGIPIIGIATYYGRPSVGYAELRQPLPQKGKDLVTEIEVLYSALGKTYLEVNEGFASALTGPFPSALEQFKQTLLDETKRRGSWFGRFQKPRA